MFVPVGVRDPVTIPAAHQAAQCQHEHDHLSLSVGCFNGDSGAEGTRSSPSPSV